MSSPESSSKMTAENVSFQTADGITLRGWFFKSTNSSSKRPCLIMSHAFTTGKNMGLDVFAKHFVSNLPLHCLIYDPRGFSERETTASIARESLEPNPPAQPRFEILPDQQASDLSDAITYTQTRDDVDPDKIGIWGTDLSGGHVLKVAGVDRRVKAVVAQSPVVEGRELFDRSARPPLGKFFDRIGVFEDSLSQQEPGTISTTDSLLRRSTQPQDSTKWEEVLTPKSLEACRDYLPSDYMHRISPAHLLMIVARNDTFIPMDATIEAYYWALDPKELHILPGGHWDVYDGDTSRINLDVQTRFLRGKLCG